METRRSALGTEFYRQWAQGLAGRKIPSLAVTGSQIAMAERK